MKKSQDKPEQNAPAPEPDEDVKPSEQSQTPDKGVNDGDVEQLEDENKKRHGVSPTEGNVVPEQSQPGDGLEVNGSTNAQEYSDDEKAKLEKELSKDNIVARVITWSGKYLKVKYFRDNKPFALYKGKNGSIKEAEKARDEAVKNDAELNS